MPKELAYSVACILAYLAGSIPFGWLVVRLKTGKDVRAMGSGNIGATNVARSIGTAWFAPVFALDFLKGFAPVFWMAPWVAKRWPCDTWPVGVMLAVFCGLSAMVGHMWPAWLGFKGGKGVATAAGIVFAMNWMAAGVALGVWILVFASARYVSLASVVAAVSLPVAQHFTGHHFWKRYDFPWIATVFFAVAAFLVILRHRSNLKRLREGTEPRFTTGKAS